jgi:hypothetical protein
VEGLVQPAAQGHASAHASTLHAVASLPSAAVAVAPDVGLLRRRAAAPQSHAATATDGDDAVGSTSSAWWTDVAAPAAADSEHPHAALLASLCEGLATLSAAAGDDASDALVRGCSKTVDLLFATGWYDGCSEPRGAAESPAAAGVVVAWLKCALLRCLPAVAEGAVHAALRVATSALLQPASLPASDRRDALARSLRILTVVHGIARDWRAVMSDGVGASSPTTSPSVAVQRAVVRRAAAACRVAHGAMRSRQRGRVSRSRDSDAADSAAVAKLDALQALLRDVTVVVEPARVDSSASPRRSDRADVDDRDGVTGGGSGGEGSRSLTAVSVGSRSLPPLSVSPTRRGQPVSVSPAAVGRASVSGPPLAALTVTAAAAASVSPRPAQRPVLTMQRTAVTHVASTRSGVGATTDHATMTIAGEGGGGVETVLDVSAVSIDSSWTAAAAPDGSTRGDVPPSSSGGGDGGAAPHSDSAAESSSPPASARGSIHRGLMSPRAASVASRLEGVDDPVTALLLSMSKFVFDPHTVVALGCETEPRVALHTLSSVAACLGVLPLASIADNPLAVALCVADASLLLPAPGSERIPPPLLPALGLRVRAVCECLARVSSLLRNATVDDVGDEGAHGSVLTVLARLTASLQQTLERVAGSVKRSGVQDSTLLQVRGYHASGVSCCSLD